MIVKLGSFQISPIFGVNIKKYLKPLFYIPINLLPKGGFRRDADLPKVSTKSHQQKHIQGFKRTPGIHQNPQWKEFPTHELLVIQVRGSSSRWYFGKSVQQKQIQEFKGICRILAIYPPQSYPPHWNKGLIRPY